MILPNQIKEQEFTFVKGMYKAQEVDEFLNEVSAAYDQTFRQNGELIKKLEILADKVEEYRNDEDNIRIALLAAQRAADQLTKEAKASAEKTISEADESAAAVKAEAKYEAEKALAEAKAEAERILSDAKAEAEKLLDSAKVESERAVADYQRNKKIEEVALEAIKAENARFKAELLEMYNAHISLINELPGIVNYDSVESEKTPAAEPEEEETEAVEEAFEAESEAADEAVEEAFDGDTIRYDISELNSKLEEAEEKSEEEEISAMQEAYDIIEDEEPQEELSSEPYDLIDDESDFDLTVDESPAEEEPVEETSVSNMGRKQSFEEAFAAFFNDEEGEEEDFSELDELENEFNDDTDFDDDDFSMFGADDGDNGAEKGGFSRFFRRK